MIKVKFSKKSIDEIRDKNVVRLLFVDTHERVQTFRDADGRHSLEIGIENSKSLNARQLRLFLRKAIRTAKDNKIKKLAVDFEQIRNLLSEKMAIDQLAELVASNFELANFDFVAYKTSSSHNFIEEITISGNVSAKVKSGFKAGQLIGDQVNQCRTLVDTPSMDLTPPSLVERLRNLFRNTKVEVEVLDVKKMKELKMGGILAVSRGSMYPPQFVLLKYKNAGDKQPIVFVGKGVTFDSGGMNLKPGQSQLGMHMDMAGAGSVIHAIYLASKLELKTNAVGAVAIVENMISRASYRPGDILTTMSGKTVEVLNTDAEGRIILADALTYVQRYQPRLIIDIATLTGAAMVALGQRASAIFTQYPQYEQLIRDCGEKSGNYVWPLPLWDEYDGEIRGTFADISNIQKASRGRYGGAIIGAIFLKQFVENCPWVHIDIAPRLTSLSDDYLSTGATGEPVALLAKVLESMDNL